MSKKVRVNVSVDEELLSKAKTKLDLFGGKLSTLFNAYLREFSSGMEKEFSDEHKSLIKRIEELEKKVNKIEKSKT
jgi:antitoxin component of RelBE/YafQ-DinJ toxin-antitoxin module